MYRWEIIAGLAASRILGIVRADDRTRAYDTARSLIDAGIRALEITLTTPDALGIMRDLTATHPNILVGAGTVLDETHAGAALDAGAHFLVSPHLTEPVIRTGHRHGAAVVPGAATTTEIITALESGADAIKIFPASNLGPGWIREVHAPLPHAPLIPTGGITIGAVPAWIDAGAIACGLGSGLTHGTAQQIHDRVTALLATLP
jgi:2-dehydro-3-deoxyphosphogluconate aldolase/(4S)-4-hydroxy-2-oxoglutarate aldolase